MKDTTLRFTKSFFLLGLLLLCISCEQEVFIESQNKEVSVDYGNLYINSNPSGASIYLNDKYTGFVTPDTIKWVQSGDVKITLKKANFWDTTFTVKINDTAPENILVDYFGNPRMYGSIICSSTPPGAAIYLNNVNTGYVTPDTLNRVIPDSYIVKFEYPEFRKDSVFLTVRSKITSTAVVTLEDTLDIITYKSTNSGNPADLVNDITEDKDGNIWLATATKGLVKFDGKKFHTYSYGSSSFIPSDYVSQIEVDKDNNLWAGFSNALVKYDGNTWETTNSKQINSIFISDNNTMLAATDRGGIIKYKEGVYDILTQANSGLTNNWITSVCMDKSNRIWAALGSTGIDYLDGSSWVHLDSAGNGLPFNRCSSLSVSPAGNVLGIFWQFVESGGGVAPYVPHILGEYDGYTWNKLSTRNDYTAIRQIYVDNKDGCWFDLGGIFRLINGSLVPIADIVRKDLRVLRSYINPSGTILSGKGVLVDSKENLWLFGGSSGVVKIKKGRWSY